MYIVQLLADKQLKPKEKTGQLANAILDGTLTIGDLLQFAATAKDSPRATAIEALEFATRQQPSIAPRSVLDFAVASLSHKAPRVRWEAAKVIGNIAGNFPAMLDDAIAALIANTTHAGTVVRWSAAFALGQIAELNTAHNATLLPAMEAIATAEEKASIKKIYTAAIKKATR